MSRSLYGARDRRIPQKEAPNTLVHDAYDAIWRKCNPPVLQQNRASIETQVNQIAFNRLSEEDKVRINGFRQALKENCQIGFGEAAANQILTKLGVLFLKSGKYRREE